MTRALAMLLAVVLLCSIFTACGEATTPSTGGQSTTSASTTTTAGVRDETDTSTSASYSGSTALTTVANTTTSKRTVKPTTATTLPKPSVSVLTPPKTTTTGATTTTKKPTTTKPVTVKPLAAIDPDDYYGRMQLSGDLRKAYDRIAEAVEHVEATVEFDGLTVPKNDLMRVVQHYRDDYPQHFYLSNDNLSYVYSGNKVESLSLTYTMSKSEIATAKAKLQKQVDALLKDVHGGLTAYERERIIYHRLINHVTYTASSDPAIYTMYGALVNKKAVCDGYSHALQYLLYCAGIECIRVSGDSKGIPHVWNMVKLSNKWYHVDVTWDDPLIQGISDFAGYSYFNLTEAQIKEDHNIVPIKDGGTVISYDHPTATATDFNYFKQTGPTLSSFQYDKVLAHCRAVAESGESWAGFKITGSVDKFIEAFSDRYFDLQAAVPGYFKKQYVQTVPSAGDTVYINIK